MCVARGRMVNGDFCFTWNHCNLVSILNFELVVCYACPKQHGQVAPSQKFSLSKAVFEAVLHYSHRKIQERRNADKENEPAVDSFNLCSENGLVGLFTNKKSGRGITAVTDKEIHWRNENYTAKYQEDNVPVKCSRMQYLWCEYCNIWKFIFLPRVMFL